MLCRNYSNYQAKKKNGADYNFFSQPQYAVKLFDYKLYPK